MNLEWLRKLELICHRGNLFQDHKWFTYLWGLSFLEGILTLRLRASNHTLSPVTNDLGGISGLMRRCKAFCASDLDSSSCLKQGPGGFLTGGLK